MKKIKKLTALLWTLCFLFVYAQASNAEALADIVLSLQLDNPIMEVNGVSAEIDPGRGTMPVVKDGRTLVPIRAIIEAFGGTVGWEEGTKAVILTIENTAIKLFIDSDVAYLNSEKEEIDTAPTIINGRTMIPIRFVAEGFNIGVAWDASDKRVTLIRDSFTPEEYSRLMSMLPDYSTDAYAVINNNKPFFKDYEIIKGSFEYYSPLDDLGRCDVCFTSLAEDLMPREERESISSVTPTGWINAKYDEVPGGYLYNRCHLIGYQLTGENANERNLITGTRYLNTTGMLPFENKIADYAEEAGNRVMYRSTPVFTGNNLVADGVLLEAFSVDDNGEDISFCVFCYNVQPKINIDYATGASTKEDSAQSFPEYDSQPENAQGNKIYRTPTGERYHLDGQCGGKNSYETTLEEATSSGLTPCRKCAL